MLVCRHLRSTLLYVDDPDVGYAIDEKGVVSRKDGSSLTEEDVAILTAFRGFSVVPDPEQLDESPEDASDSHQEEAWGDQAEVGELDIELATSVINDYYKADIRRTLDRLELDYESDALKAELVEALAKHLTTREHLDNAIAVLEGEA